MKVRLYFSYHYKDLCLCRHKNTSIDLKKSMGKSFVDVLLWAEVHQQSFYPCILMLRGHKCPCNKHVSRKVFFAHATTSLGSRNCISADTTTSVAKTQFLPSYDLSIETRIYLHKSPRGQKLHFCPRMIRRQIMFFLLTHK